MVELKPGTEVVFPGTEEGTILFDDMRKAGILRGFRHEGRDEGWTVWGTELDDGRIIAHIRD